jgi:ribosomal protein S18 acetylase RimI-like enzyme
VAQRRVLAGQLDLAATSFLVAEEEGRIVAHAFASALQPPILFVARLYVLPASQGLGIGTALLRELFARHPSATLARLSVVEGNDGALGFYRKAGFRIIDTSREDGIVSLHLERAIR